jgi:hypothetical protein
MTIPPVARRSGLTLVMSLPSYKIAPSVGWCRPAIVRSSVDLPAPFAPMIAYTSPGNTRSDTRSSARSWPWCTVRSRTSSRAVPSWPGPSVGASLMTPLPGRRPRQ